MATARQRNASRELAFATCRAMGHEWNHSSPIGTDDPEGRFKAPFGGTTGMIGYPSTCGSCGTERMRWITRWGETLVRYEHPEGYSRTGEDKLSPREWRETFVAAAFEQFAAAIDSAPRKLANARSAS